MSTGGAGAEVIEISRLRFSKRRLERELAETSDHLGQLVIRRAIELADMEIAELTSRRNGGQS